MVRIDWDYWKHRYVSCADRVTLELLSMRPNAPSIATLKRHSRRESWAEQRKQFRYQVATTTAQSAARAAALQQTAQLVDAAETVTRHLKLARALQSKAVTALQSLDSQSLSPRDILAWLVQATQIERLALGI